MQVQGATWSSKGQDLDGHLTIGIFLNYNNQLVQKVTQQTCTRT